MSAQSDLYDSIVSDTTTLTARPDLADEIAVAVRTATLSIHNRYSWPRDLVTQLVRLPNASNITAVDAQVLLPRLKGLSSVRLVDAEGNPLNGEEAQIEVVEIDDTFDPIYRTLKNNIAYLAGTTVNIRSYIAAHGYLISYYQVRRVRRDEYDSWIAQLAPDVIVYQAASIVFSTNGNEEKARAYSNMVEKQFLPELVTNFLTSAQR